MKPRNKILFLSTVGIIALLIAGFFTFTAVVEMMLKTEILKALPPNSSVESVSYFPFSSSVEIRNLQIPNPPGYAGKRNAVSVKQIYADLNAPALFRHLIYFEKLHVGEAEISVEFKKIPTSFWDIMILAWTRTGVNLLDLQKSIQTTAHTQSVQLVSKRPSKEGKPWKMRIDKLTIASSKISFGNLENSAALVDLAIVELLKMIPADVPGGETTRNMIGTILRRSVAPYIRRQLQSLQDASLSLNQYEQRDLGKDEKSTCAGIAYEIAQRHWNQCLDICEEKLKAYRDDLQEKWDSFKKEVEKWLERMKKWRRGVSR